MLAFGVQELPISFRSDLAANEDCNASRICGSRGLRFQDAGILRAEEVLKGKLFLHASLVPLDQVVFNPDDTRDKFNRTCEGMCGV